MGSRKQGSKTGGNESHGQDSIDLDTTANTVQETVRRDQGEMPGGRKIKMRAEEIAFKCFLKGHCTSGGEGRDEINGNGGKGLKVR